MEIYGKNVSKEKEDFIVSTVQEKRELNNFSDKYILKYAEHLLKKDKKLLETIATKEKINKKDIDKLIKEIREKARRIYSVYIPNKYNKKDDFLKKEKITDSDLLELLDIHFSTKERLNNYEEIYTKLVEHTQIPKKIIDLGCGLNPFSIIHIAKCSNQKIKDMEYIASDISEKDVEFIQKIFDKSEINGKTIRLDLSDESDIKQLSHFHADWCLLFKALDPIEESNEDISYKLIPAIKAKWIIASFPTVTMSHIKMDHPRRSWFEKVLTRVNLTFETFEVNNELFYIIKNH